MNLQVNKMNDFFISGCFVSPGFTGPFGNHGFGFDLGFDFGFGASVEWTETKLKPWF